MADPTATDGDFHVNASSTPIDLAPYPGAGAEDRVERLMPGRCVAAARHAVVGRRLWLETGAGYTGPAATLDGPAWLEVDGRVARVPRASGGERFFRAPTRAVQLFAGPRRTAAFRGEVRRHECVRCAPELIRDAQTNELWARLVDGERFVCVSERAATEGENDATLALEAVEMTGYFCNCYARHYAGELPARTAPRLDAPRAAAVPPWVCFKAAEVRLAPRDDDDDDRARGLLWVRICASLEIRRGDDDYEPWVVDGWCIATNANTGAHVLEPVPAPLFEREQWFRNVYSRGALPLRAAPGGGFRAALQEKASPPPKAPAPAPAPAAAAATTNFPWMKAAMDKSPNAKLLGEKANLFGERLARASKQAADATKAAAENARRQIETLQEKKEEPVARRRVEAVARAPLGSVLVAESVVLTPSGQVWAHVTSDGDEDASDGEDDDTLESKLSKIVGDETPKRRRSRRSAERWAICRGARDGEAILKPIRGEEEERRVVYRVQEAAVVPRDAPRGAVDGAALPLGRGDYFVGTRRRLGPKGEMWVAFEDVGGEVWVAESVGGVRDSVEVVELPDDEVSMNDVDALRRAFDDKARAAREAERAAEAPSEPEEAPPPPAGESSDRRASRARLLEGLDAFADEITQPAPARDPVDELDARLTVDASLTRTRAPSLLARCCARGRSIVVCSVSCADAAAAGVVVRLYVDAHASPLAERRTGLADGRDARKATCVFDAPPTGGVVVASAVDRAGRDVRGLEASCPVDAPDDDDDCFFLGWLFPKPAPPSLELPGRRRNRKPKYAKVATTPSAGGFAIADDSSDSDGDMV